MTINTMPAEEVWGPDPVHPLPRVYAKLADTVVKMATGLRELQDNKRRRTDSDAGDSAHNSRRRDSESFYSGNFRSRGGPPGQHHATGGRGRGWGPQDNGRERGRTLGRHPGRRGRGRF
jgi:hypothetical protein